MISGTMNQPQNIMRTQNWIGRSNWGSGDANIYGYYDDMMIFNTALTAAQVKTVMSTNNY